MGSACSSYGECTKHVQSIGEETSWKAQLERSRSKWKDNVKTNLTETGCKDR